jgi:hypothetical protein
VRRVDREGAAAGTTGVEGGGEQRRVVDKVAACGVHEEAPAAHRRERRCVRPASNRRSMPTTETSCDMRGRPQRPSTA